MSKVRAFCRVGVFDDPSFVHTRDLACFQKVVCALSYTRKRVKLEFKDPVFFYTNHAMDDIHTFLTFDDDAVALDDPGKLIRFAWNHYEHTKKVSKVGSRFRYALKTLTVFFKPEDIADPVMRENYYAHAHYRLAQALKAREARGDSEF